MGTPLGWHRRQALVLASQLPDKQSDALLVLEAARELVERFLTDAAEDQGSLAANVLPFGK